MMESLQRQQVRQTLKYKTGDKVYVHPCFGERSRAFKNYIRATVIHIRSVADGGYWVKAFHQDLPGGDMFNLWDEDLLSRTDRSHKPLPESDQCR